MPSGPSSVPRAVDTPRAVRVPSIALEPEGHAEQPIGKPRSAPVSEPRTLHPLPVRQFAVASLAFVALVLLTRIPFASKYLFNWDAGNFAFALDYYNIAWHQPHPPGYPVYVVIAWLLRKLTGDANAAYVTMSIAASVLAVVAVLGVTWRIAGPVCALMASMLFVISPNVWGHGLITSPRIVLALISATLAWLTVEARWGKRDYSGLGAVVLALGGGLRPDLLPFLGLLWLYGAIARGWRSVVLGVVIGTLIVIGWLRPSIDSIGWPAYRQSLADSAAFWAPEAQTLKGYLIGVNTNLNKVIDFSVLSLGPVATVLLLVGIAAPLLMRGRSDVRWRMLWPILLVWVVPSLAFSILVHINEPGHILTFIPALTILAGIGMVTLATRVAELTLFRLAPAVTMVVVSLLAIVSNTIAFATATEPDIVSWQYIRMVDEDTAAELALMDSFPVDSTLVLSVSRFRQLYYYRPEYYRKGRLISVLDVLGRFEDVPPSDYTPPPGTRTIVVLDIPSVSTDPGIALQQSPMPYGVPATIAQIEDGDTLVLRHRLVTFVRGDHAP